VRREQQREADLISFLKNLLSRRRIPDDRVVIEQAPFYDGLEARRRRTIELDRAIEKKRERIALTVGSWARDTVYNRQRAAIPRSVRRDVAAWLPGLGAQEVMNLASASAFDVRHHIFGEELIAGVRKVQPLPESVLIWPRPKLVADRDNERGAGGGPRLKARKLG
jgi:hypothetical protein